MRTRLSIGTLLVAAILLTGCPHLRPNWFNPGPAELQRSRAIQHDPYPDQDAGPAIIGGRPLDFANPNAEPVRNQPQQSGIGIPAR